MRVRSHPPMDDVKVGRLAGFEIEELANVLHVGLGGFMRLHLTWNTVHLATHQAGFPDEMLVGEAEVAVGVVGRHGAFIHEKQVHPIPSEARGRQGVEVLCRRDPSRNRHRCAFLAGQHFGQQTQGMPRARFCRCARIGILMPSNAHEFYTSVFENRFP